MNKRIIRKVEILPHDGMWWFSKYIGKRFAITGEAGNWLETKATKKIRHDQCADILLIPKKYTIEV